MTSSLSEEEKKRFTKEVDGLKLSLEEILDFSKTNLVLFNGITLENYSSYFLDIFARFRLNCEGLDSLMNSYKDDYRLKVCTNLLLRSICSDVLAATYLLTFYDKDDPECTSLKNELDIASAEFLRSITKLIEEDKQLFKIHEVSTSTTAEEKRNLFYDTSSHLLTEDGKIKNRGQLRETTPESLKEGLKTAGGFITEDEKLQRIKSKGLAQFGFSYSAFKYYSQFQHFTSLARKLFEAKPFHDNLLMALTLDQMLMAIDLILQFAKSPNPSFREDITILRDKLLENFA